jgi:CHAT domain-containing protein
VNVVVGRLSTDRSKRRFGIGKDALTYHLANADIAKGDLSTLFVDLERGRARAFVDMMAAQKISTVREKKLAEQIQSVDSEIRAYRLKSAAPLQPSEADDINIRMLLEMRIGLVEKLRENDPKLADIYGISTTTLASTQKRLNSNDLLIYAIPSRAGEPIRWLEITIDEAKVRTLDLPHRELRKKLGAFRDAAKLGAASSSDQNRILAAISKSLQIENWGSNDAVYIVPSGQLYFVPWGALSIFAPIAILPNGGWIARAPNSSNLSAAVILGDPNFHGALPQLKVARTEAVRVSKHYGTDPLIGSSATNRSMRREVGNGGRILHIATHAAFDARSPLKSALYLGGENGAVALTAGSLFENPLTADLVILSACETGVGKAVAGDDFLGLPRSFYLAGARTVLNSLLVLPP